MKNFLIPLFLLTILISCDKKPDDLKYSRTIPVGCALQIEPSSKRSQVSDVDTVTYSIIDGNLDIFVGFNAGCCAPYKTSYEIKESTIFIKIVATKIGACNCICYYTYDFNFIGTGANYKYNVTVNDNLSFTGEIKL